MQEFPRHRIGRRASAAAVTEPESQQQDEANQGNDFQQDYAKCEDGDNGGLVGTVIDSALTVLGPATQVLTMTDNPLRCTLKAGAANPVDAAATGLENAASAFWGDPVGKLAKAVMEGSVSAFAMVMTFWMSVPIPGLSGAAGMNGIRNITFELQFVFLAFGIVFAAIKLAIARKQAVLDGAEESARMITRTIFAVTLLPLLVLTLHAIGDSFSSFVIEKAAGEGSGTINGIAWIDEETGLGPVVSLLFAGLALLGSVVQLIALIVREAISHPGGRARADGCGDLRHELRSDELELDHDVHRGCVAVQAGRIADLRVRVLGGAER
ncbi:hypothetical protein GS440_19155 [Rhodococcus hoagii]|nr:hypothetical protein [Prescottella equi]